MTHSRAHQDAMESSKTMVTQMTLVKFNESKNDTKGPDCGKVFCKENWVWKGRLKSMRVRVIIMYYTHELIFQRTSLVKV